jgi:cobyrinic acid a,c-diamide synthase
MASLFLSAAHKSSGKTTLSIGLCAALVKRGLDVQPFKKGPDYIDPIWLGMAAGKPCYNLDFFVAGRQETIDDYCYRGQAADICLVEGNKGLHDGLDLDGSNSNAALAKALQSPVIMVVDARGTMRGIAPLLIGYQVFDKEVNIAGVIHLGLIPGYEDPDSRHKINTIARAVSDNVDLDKLLEIAQQAKPVKPATSPLLRKPEFTGLRIGIAQDSAFGFYYPGDLEAFRQAGAQLLSIDTTRDQSLPTIDGLFIGGGFPERHAATLAANSAMRDSIKTAIEAGLPTYAECGGLMYLSKSLTWNETSYDMVGVLDAKSVMHEKPQGRGYVKLGEIEGQHPWALQRQPGNDLHAHEFHYSELQGLPEDGIYAYQVLRGKGIQQQQDGFVYKNLLASYTHLRDSAANPWVKRFLHFVTINKTSSVTEVANAL